MSDATHNERVVRTAQADEAIEIRNEAIRAINKIAQERHALWQDYLATVRSYDAMTAERDALSKQVGVLRAALSEAIDRLDRGFYAADVSTRLRSALA